MSRPRCMGAYLLLARGLVVAILDYISCTPIVAVSLQPDVLPLSLLLPNAHVMCAQDLENELESSVNRFIASATTMLSSPLLEFLDKVVRCQQSEGT